MYTSAFVRISINFDLVHLKVLYKILNININPKIYNYSCIMYSCFIHINRCSSPFSPRNNMLFLNAVFILTLVGKLFD